jgi:hypothetical protein
VWSQPTPLGSGFNYLGEIRNDGVLVDAPIHLLVSLWDAPEEGQRIGEIQQLTDIPVTQGQFSILVNGEGEFGPEAFNGEERWLQIELCADAGCDGTTVLLSPRQQLTGTPYALSALSAPWSGLSDVPDGFADGIDDRGDSFWERGGNDLHYEPGNVAIGSGTPHHRLRISGGPLWTSNQ